MQKKKKLVFLLDRWWNRDPAEILRMKIQKEQNPKKGIGKLQFLAGVFLGS